MADDAKLMKYIAFRKRLQRDIKLIFHKDKQLDWDEPNYSSEALQVYIDFILSAYEIDEDNKAEAPHDIDLVAHILDCLTFLHNDDEFYHAVDNYILDNGIDIKLRSVEE